VAVTVTNVPPTATFSAPATASAGSPFTISLSGGTDPSAADAASLTYAFDCGDGAGYGPAGTATSRSCPTSDTGTRTVKGKVIDKDGGATEYTATVQVTVTFDSLCALTRAYSTRPAVADALCVILKSAQKAPNALSRNLLLAAYRLGVDLATIPPVRAFTPQQAATLKQLSTRL
jgi:hypothetical protein